MVSTSIGTNTEGRSTRIREKLRFVFWEVGEGQILYVVKAGSILKNEVEVGNGSWEQGQRSIYAQRQEDIY